MKTPKREKAKLWNAVAETANESLTWGEIECSRWKRKNKLTQLKRTIARQKRVWKDYLDVIELYFGDEMNTMWWQDQEGS